MVNFIKILDRKILHLNAEFFCLRAVMFWCAPENNQNLRLKGLVNLTSRRFIHKEYHGSVIQYYA